MKPTSVFSRVIVQQVLVDKREKSDVTKRPWFPCSWGAAPSCWPQRTHEWLCGCWRWPWCRPGPWRTPLRRSGCPSSSVRRVSAGGASLCSLPHWCSGPVKQMGLKLCQEAADFIQNVKLKLSVPCTREESCWSNGTLCFLPLVWEQLISSFPHCWIKQTLFSFV